MRKLMKWEYSIVYDFAPVIVKSGRLFFFILT